MIIHWHELDWPCIYKTVRRLQARIVKATQTGKWRKVRSLQRLLTRSFSSKALAVRKVTENSGKKTPGTDGVLWNTPTRKIEAIETLKAKGYKALPLRRIFIPKSNGKKRPLSIPTMKCRAMQALYQQALDPVAETLADLHSYGFRRERNAADAMRRCYNLLFRNHAPQWILEADIHACFDKISHDWMLNHIPMDKTILRKWLKAGCIHRQTFHHTEEETPQGGIISPVACNLTLDGLETLLLTRFGKHRPSLKVNLVRYADDFIVTGSSRELLENDCLPLIKEFLAERGLKLSKEKTRIIHIDEGFDFLGQNVRKYQGTLLIRPSKKNVQTFLEKIRSTLHGNRQAKAGYIVALLNPMIRGWANYHRHAVSKVIFGRVDNLIFQKLWGWSVRRHPQKNSAWVKKKYFPSNGARNWTFSGTTEKGEHLVLTQAKEVPITRHLQIRGDANPYDPSDELYFEKRLENQWRVRETGRRRLTQVWKRQKGLCPVCLQRISDEQSWQLHHIIRRVDGGTDNLENLVLLHPNCHRQVHSRMEVWETGFKKLCLTNA